MARKLRAGTQEILDGSHKGNISPNAIYCGPLFLSFLQPGDLVIYYKKTPRTHISWSGKFLKKANIKTAARPRGDERYYFETSRGEFWERPDELKGNAYVVATLPNQEPRLYWLTDGAVTSEDNDEMFALKEAR